MIRYAALLPALLCIGEPALAHAPIKGIGAFYNGVLHPVLVPAHLLLLLGLGLLLGQHAPHRSRYGWFFFVAAFLIGLVIGQRIGSTVPEAVLFALALITGLLVALDRPLGVPFVAALATASGMGIGLDSAPDSAISREAWLALSGTGVAGVLILSYVGGLAAGRVLNWQRIGIRIAGSWTAASAGLVLALVVSAPKVVG